MCVGRLLGRDHHSKTSAHLKRATPRTEAPVALAQILPFYRIALLAAVFQAAFVLLLPWAVGFVDLLAVEAEVLVVVAVFVLILLSALVYASRRRALDWQERSPISDSDG